MNDWLSQVLQIILQQEIIHMSLLKSCTIKGGTKFETTTFKDSFKY